MFKRIKPLLLSTLGAAALSGSAWAGAGDDCCDDIEDLQRQILLLQSQLDELKEQRGLMDHTVSWDPVPRIKSNDGKFTWAPRGRLLFDYANVSVDENGGNIGDLDTSGTQLRSGRLGIEGTIFASTHYVFELEFGDDAVPISLDPTYNAAILSLVGVEPRFIDPLLAGDSIVVHEDNAGIEVIDGTNGDLDVRISDAYLWWDLTRSLRLKVGQFKEPISMGQRTSLAQTDLMEKPGLSTAFGYGRRVGVEFQVARPRLLVSFAGFGENANVKVSPEEGWAIATRAGWMPIKRENTKMYLGAWWEWRDFAADFPYQTYYVKPSNMAAYPFASLGLFPADHDLVWGGDAALALGPVSVQGEIMRIKPDLPGTIKPDDPIFWSYYIQGSWFITGERRSFSMRDGAFTRTRVRRPVNDGGWGAWQLAARWDVVNLSDDPRFIGGKQTSITGGLNWYLNDYVRLMANYVHSKIEGSDGSFNQLLALGLPHDADVNTIEFRAQIDFGPSSDSEWADNGTPTPRKGRFHFTGEPGFLWVGVPDWSYGTDGAGGPLLGFSPGKDGKAPNFYVAGQYEPDEPWIADGTRLGLFINYFSAFSEKLDFSNSKSCIGCPDLYVSVDGTMTTTVADPLIDGVLNVDYNYWDTGLTFEVDHDLGDRFVLTKKLALYGGGQQQEYSAVISDGGPIASATSYDNEIFEDVDTWRAGLDVGLRATFAMSNHFSAFLGGNVGYVRENSDLKAQDCSDGFPGDGSCSVPSWETISKDQKTFNSYRAGAELGLNIDFGHVNFGLVGLYRNDFVPEVQNPRMLGDVASLKKNRETSYGGRFHVGITF